MDACATRWGSFASVTVDSQDPAAAACMFAFFNCCLRNATTSVLLVTTPRTPVYWERYPMDFHLPWQCLVLVDKEKMISHRALPLAPTPTQADYCNWKCVKHLEPVPIHRTYILRSMRRYRERHIERHVDEENWVIGSFQSIGMTTRNMEKSCCLSTYCCWHFVWSMNCI